MSDKWVEKKDYGIIMEKGCYQLERASKYHEYGYEFTVHKQAVNKWKFRLMYLIHERYWTFNLYLVSSPLKQTFAQYKIYFNNKRVVNKKCVFTVGSAETSNFSVSMDKSYCTLCIQLAAESKETSHFNICQGEVSERAESKNSVAVDEAVTSQCEILYGKLQYDLLCMLKYKKFSDFVIKVQDGSTFPVHRNILSARSPVFCAMLSHETLEKETKCIEIVDFDAKTVQELIRFIYSGQAPSFKDIQAAANLLQAADKYSQCDLKEICASHLASNLSKSNVMNILLIADSHSASYLKIRALEFICKNKSCFKSAEDYSDIVKKRPSLLAEILAKDANMKI